MKHRKLRIAWSVAWGVVVVLLCVLWVRSYWLVNRSEWHATNMPVFFAESVAGRVLFGARQADEWDYKGWWWKSESVEDAEHLRDLLYFDPHDDHFEIAGFQLTRDSVGASLIAPYFFIVTAIAAIAAVPRLRWSKRFSLRTLLIATTLITVVLGIIVWMLV
jgi:hypothetical protein